jgi:hypothetical protein
MKECGRRLTALKQNLTPEGSGRAVTPDCSRILKGSDNTVETHDCRNEIHLERWHQHLAQQLVTEADFLISIMAKTLA